MSRLTTGVPTIKGRDIDLSKRAAKELGITKEGVAAVKIEAEIAPADKSKEKRSPGQAEACLRTFSQANTFSAVALAPFQGLAYSRHLPFI